jgi:hypothetical protein
LNRIRKRLIVFDVELKLVFDRSDLNLRGVLAGTLPQFIDAALELYAAAVPQELHRDISDASCADAFVPKTTAQLPHKLRHSGCCLLRRQENPIASMTGDTRAGRRRYEGVWGQVGLDSIPDSFLGEGLALGWIEDESACQRSVRVGAPRALACGPPRW